MSKIEQVVWDAARPIAQEQNVEIYDVELKKEGTYWFLRVYIEKDEGIGLEDCEHFSRALNEKLDALNITQHDFFEVSSPGLDRVLNREKHYIDAIGKEVEIKLFRALDGTKHLEGVLISYLDGELTIQGANQSITIPKDNVALTKLKIAF
ncbi:MAG: ribosome maturation factor RimP [Hyphomonadaceae bacterium]|nr:ribosome maturation factor RimP [Clostridia bacterium]